MFLKTVKQVKLEVRPLFLPQLVQLTSLLKPGLTRIKVRIRNNDLWDEQFKSSNIFPVNLLYSTSGQTTSGQNFMRNAKMLSKHLMCLLSAFMTFMPIVF